MRIIVVRPDERPELREIEHSLESMQAVVQGLIDILRVDPTLDLVFNDEFLYDSDLRPSLAIGDVTIHGTCFFCAHDTQGESQRSRR